jgi:hypothetical protein
MATTSTFYLNAPSLGSATAAFLDSNLTICGPDGFYSDGVIVREQVDCVLLPQQTCPSCAVPCGDDINGAGGQGVYLVNLDAGTDIGAIIVRFDPYSVPDGIRATFDGLVYNKLTSPVDGLHQSSNVGHYTFVGSTGADCGISGSTYPALQEFLYDGFAFVPTGLTQSVTVAPGDVSLGAADPGSCMMVIPKTSASPSIINFEMVGPCLGTAWLGNIACPVLLTSFGSSEGYSSFALACEAGLTENYYNASLDNTPGIVDVFDFVYSDNIGVSPLADGFYNATGNIAGGADWFEVQDGVVVAVGDCAPPVPTCPDRRVVFQICNANVARDDNFDIYLNGTYIGAVDLNADAQVGSVFIADSNPLVTLGSSDFACPLGLMVTYHFPPALLLSANVLEMRNTQDNGNGNFGTVGVRNYSLSGTTLSSPCVITDLEYSGASGLSFTFNFNYTECCAT